MRRLLPALIIAATFTAFLPALSNGFVDWDDDKILLDNPNYRGLGAAGLRWMFTTFYMGHYQPLTWLTFAVDHALWGMNPTGYHLSGIALHAINAALLYCIALRLFSIASSTATGAIPHMTGAAVAALLFALHPLRVESVVWATERRDVLSGCFFLATLLCYLRAATAAGDRRAWLGGAVAFYLLSLLAKASGITLPLVLVLLDIYPLKRWSAANRADSIARKIRREKIPFFALALFFAAVALAAQRESGILRGFSAYPISNRLAQAAYGLCFYLWKTIAPAGLSPLYQLPIRFDPLAPRFVLSAAAALAISVCLYRLRRRWPAGASAWVYYCAMLAPVLGFAQSGPQLVADRYSYLACLGWALLAGAAVFYSARSGGRAFKLAVAASAVIVAVLGTLSWRQTHFWRDTETLWRRALAVDPDTSLAHNNLGMTLAGRGELDEAAAHYRRALALDPVYANGYVNLGLVHLKRGDIEGAASEFRRAIEIDPRAMLGYFNLGIALAKKNDFGGAAAEFRKAIELRPDLPQARFNLGMALALGGDLPEAREQFARAVDLDPDYAAAHYELAEILTRLGRSDEGRAHYRRALELRPDFSKAREALGGAPPDQR